MKKHSKLLTESIHIGIIILLLAGCAPSEALSTPISSLTPTPVPTPSIYQSWPNFSFRYPAGWHYEESDEGLISIASREHIQPMQNSYNDGEIVIEIINVLDTPSSGFGDSFKALEAFTNHLWIKMPDQEPVHKVNLNGRDFIIGGYSDKYIGTAWFGNRAPLFLAVYLTDQNTIIVDMYAARTDEVQLRRAFEDILASIEDKP